MAGTEYVWRVETTRPRAQRIDIFAGETVRLRAEMFQRSRPVWFGDGATAAIYWQKEGMGGDWWTAEASVEGNTVEADWLPAFGPGPEYTAFLAVRGAGGLTYRAFAEVSIRHAPGEVPNELPLPAKTIDFDAVTVENAPWALVGHPHVEADIAGLAEDLAAKADRAPSEAEGRLAAFDSEGNPADSGIALSGGAIPAASVSGLAAVATTGAYSSLSGKPSIPTALKCPAALTIGVIASSGASTQTLYDGSVARTVSVPPETRPFLTLVKSGPSTMLQPHRVYTYTAQPGLPTGSGTVKFFQNMREHEFGTITYQPSTMYAGALDVVLTVTDPDSLTGIPKGSCPTATAWGNMMLGIMATDNYTALLFGLVDLGRDPGGWGSISINGRNGSNIPAAYSSSSHTSGPDAIALGVPAQDCTIIVDCTSQSLALSMAQPSTYPYFSDDGASPFGTLESGYVYRIDIDSFGTNFRKPSTAMMNGYVSVKRLALHTS